VAKPLPEHALGVGRLCAHFSREVSLTIVHC
jgi:hypothetical protein